MTGDRRRSTGAGCRILLLAMAMQGLTPDRDGLVSAHLLRLLAPSPAESGFADVDRRPSPSPSPIHGRDRYAPEACPAPPARAVHRACLVATIRPIDACLPADPLDRPASSTADPPQAPWALARGAAGLIRSLCRFLC